MFRVITKTSRITFTENYKCSSRLYKTIRHYSKKEKDFCPPTKPQKGRSPLLYALGAVTLVGGATVAYAGYDPDFRKWLGENVPYADDVLKVLLQEETSYLEWLTSLFQDMFTKEGSKKMVKPENLEEVPIEYKPPPNVLGTLEKETPEEVYTEIRIESNRGGTPEPVYEIGGDVKPTDADLPDTHPRNMADLERKLVESAKVAVQAYNSALYALKNYNLDVQKVVESSIDSLDPQIWTSLRTKRDAKDKTLKEAEEAAAEAVQYVNKMKNVVAKKQFESSDTTKEQVKYNIQKVQGDIDIARKEYEHERQMSDVSEKYWDKVRLARTHFANELETLFPTINFEEKKMHVDPSDFDLFVLHAYSNVLFYQKELAKLETVEHEKLQYALAQAKRGDTELLTKAQVECEVEKERRKLQECYQMQCLALKCETEKELRRQLKLQSEAFADHLGDALKVREQELEREFTRKLDEQLEAEKCKFKMQMAAIMGRLQGLDKALKVRARTDKEARRAQVLWNACQQLFRSIKAGCPGVPWPQQLRPLTPEIEAIQKAAAEGDELVKAVLEGIPKEAKERGVFPEDALRERFIKVEQVARKLALVPEGGSKLPLHILSYLQSLLLVKAASPIPQAELNDEEVDFSKLTTNDILQRARYWLDRGDFTQTLRYMNLLQGAPRCVARQWMYETRIMLETQQAADTLMAHAAAIGLAYVN